MAFSLARLTPWRAFLAPLHALLSRLITTWGEVQSVPVSVFWGRAPGKRFGFWKMLAFARADQSGFSERRTYRS